MKPIDYVMLGLGATGFGLAVMQWMGKLELRVEPRVTILLSALLVGRVILRLKMQDRARQREMMLREVPKRPLGIEDDENASRL